MQKSVGAAQVPEQSVHSVTGPVIYGSLLSCIALSLTTAMLLTIWASPEAAKDAVAVGFIAIIFGAAGMIVLVGSVADIKRRSRRIAAC